MVRNGIVNPRTDGARLLIPFELPGFRFRLPPPRGPFMPLRGCGFPVAPFRR